MSRRGGIQRETLAGILLGVFLCAAPAHATSAPRKFSFAHRTSLRAAAANSLVPLRGGADVAAAPAEAPPAPKVWNKTDHTPSRLLFFFQRRRQAIAEAAAAAGDGDACAPWGRVGTGNGRGGHPRTSPVRASESAGPPWRQPRGKSYVNLPQKPHRCHPILVAFVWELTEETIDLHLGCLQGGEGERIGWRVVVQLGAFGGGSVWVWGRPPLQLPQPRGSIRRAGLTETGRLACLSPPWRQPRGKS